MPESPWSAWKCGTPGHSGGSGGTREVPGRSLITNAVSPGLSHSRPRHGPVIPAILALDPGLSHHRGRFGSADLQKCEVIRPGRFPLQRRWAVCPGQPAWPLGAGGLQGAKAGQSSRLHLENAAWLALGAKALGGSSWTLPLGWIRRR